MRSTRAAEAVAELGSFGARIRTNRQHTMKTTPLKTMTKIMLIVGLYVATAVQAADRKTIPGFGQLVDPVGDCSVKTENDKTTLTVPGPNRNLSGYFPENNKAPRILQDVQGDFTVTVKVAGDFNPQKRRGDNAFNGAGLLIWDSERNFIRVERNIWVTPEAKRLSYTPLIEHWKDGKNMTPRPGTEKPFWKGKTTYLRVKRTGDEFTIGVSHDGSQWLDKDMVTAKCPEKIKVGVAAINNSDEPFTVEFSEFKLTGIR